MALTETHSHIQNNRQVHAHRVSSPPPLPVLSWPGEPSSALAVILHDCTTVEWLWTQLCHGTNSNCSKSIDPSLSAKSSLIKTCFMKGWLHSVRLGDNHNEPAGGNVSLHLRVSSSQLKMSSVPFYCFSRWRYPYTGWSGRAGIPRKAAVALMVHLVRTKGNCCLSVLVGVKRTLLMTSSCSSSDTCSHMDINCGDHSRPCST